MSNHELGFRGAGVAAGVLLAASGCSSAETTTINLPKDQFVVVYEGTNAFDGPATDTSNNDSNNHLGEIREAVLVHKYTFIDRGPGVDDMVCIDKDIAGKENLTTYQSWLSWRFLGDVCVKAETIKEPSGEFVYPDN